MTPRQKMEKCAGAWWQSTLGRSELLWPIAAATGGRGHHLRQAAQTAEKEFVKQHSTLSTEIHGIDAQLRERKAALNELKSAGSLGTGRYVRSNIASLEKEIEKLTAKRQNLVGKLERSYNAMHKHHMNAASYMKTPGAVPDLTHYRTALDELKAGPKGGLTHFLKKWKLPLAGGALVVGGVMAVRHLRKRQAPPNGGMIPPGQVG